MDVPLQQIFPGKMIILINGFNPCFNGCSSSTSSPNFIFRNFVSFNPCFNGYSSSTQSPIYDTSQCNVSILVLMDVPLQLVWYSLNILRLFVSILVLMDVPLQQLEARIEELENPSFNPCFNGCSSST